MHRLLFFILLAVLLVPAGAGADDLKVGFVYVSPVGDEGYSYAQNMGRKEVEKMEGVSTSYVEDVCPRAATRNG